MRVRLKDVADHAGVSVKTVSNVVNNWEYVTDATRERVQKALDELGYRPNLSARSLRTGRTNLIALALPRLHEPYFAELADCVVRAAEDHGLTVLISQTDGRREREQQVVSGFRPQFIDGLLFSPLALEWDDLEEIPGHPPVVLLGERLAAGGAADHVAVDNVAAAQRATQHLVELGRKRIAVIGAPPSKTARTASLRLEGYKRALRKARIRLDKQLLLPVNQLHRADGAAAMATLLDLAPPPDAVFCFNDLLALGALRTLQERGVAVPSEVAVIGFDDIEESRFCSPSLTTISPDKKALAGLAVAALVQRMSVAPDAAPQELHAGFELVERESTMGRRA
ncbi:LacI family DNA-binding transcriptional regulator [Jiangella asiatica]|uniref:LacI family transcriptional regulator n=1 Tax=Jiangella asiatica TaxID=2530372 RepID=A0A4R5CNC3_9ACTN|nr:LacI family transcriptional regulator [Jiangella asiatica]